MVLKGEESAAVGCVMQEKGRDAGRFQFTDCTKSAENKCCAEIHDHEVNNEDMRDFSQLSVTLLCF